MLLHADTSLLVVIDIQDRLLPAMAEPARVEAGASRLMRAARRLGVPLLVSEQYPKGIGRTVPALAALATPEETVEKIHFSCAAEPAFQAQLALMGPRRQAVLCGIEAHVCVLQSALGLVADGWSVAVVEDAVSSRRPADRDAGLRRLAAAGVVVATTEMVIFEWLGRAGTDAFRDLLKLVK
jgi:nicotinamidase-related amidase